MSRVQGWLWKCDRPGCGYVWHTQGDEPPKACAGCKSRNWHVKLDKEVDGRVIAEVEAVPGALAYGKDVKVASDKALKIADSVVQDLEVGGRATWYPSVCNCGSLTGGHRSKCPMFKGKR